MLAKPTSCGIESTPTSLALEMFGFLMQGKNLQIVEVALAVVAPWPSQKLVQCGATSLLSHCGDRCTKGDCMEEARPNFAAVSR